RRAVGETDMARRIIFCLILALAPFVAAPCALAQTQADMDACHSPEGTTSDQQIKGCDAVIAANNFGGENLSIAYAKRCAAHRSKGEHDLAMADCTKAVELNPREMSAWFVRGGEYED